MSMDKLFEINDKFWFSAVLLYLVLEHWKTAFFVFQYRALLFLILAQQYLKYKISDWFICLLFVFSKVTCMKKISSNQELTKIRKILGVQQQDQPLINYWSNYL